jgi:hypothetical protein
VGIQKFVLGEEMFCRGWDGEVELENVDFRLENEAGRKERKVGTIPTKNGLIMA